jgi:transposase
MHPYSFHSLLHTPNMAGIPCSPRKKCYIAEAAQHQPSRKVAARFGCSISTVSCIYHQRATLGYNHSNPRSGRPSSITSCTMARIQRLILQHCFVSPQNLIPLLHQSGISISLSTLYRLMDELNLKRYSARLKPFLSNRAKGLQFAYAKQYQHDTLNDWKRTIFTDEAAMKLGGTFKTYVTRRKGEAYKEENMVPRLHGATGMVMVWGAIWHGGRSKLVRFDQRDSEGKRGGVTAAIYRDQITKGELKVCWNRVNGSWRAYGGARIVEDGAKIHTLPTNRSVGLKQRFIYLQHPPYVKVRGTD